MKEKLPLPFDKQTMAIRKIIKEEPERFAAILKDLPPKELESVLYNGDFWLRDNQVFHHYPESIVFFMGGRGTGKSFSGSHWVKKMVEEYGAKNIGIIGPTAFDVRNVMIDGPSGIMNTYPPSERPLFEPSKRTLTFRNNAKGFVFSAQDGDKVRGNNFDLLWCDEIVVWQDPDVFDQAMLALRSGISKALLTSTPKATKLIVDLWKRKDKDVRFIHGTTYENLHNLSKAYKEQIIAQYEGTRLGAAELEGKLILTNPGALWTPEVLASCSVDQSEVPELVKIVVAVDPSGTSTKSSDECGIIVAGIDALGVCYIIEDGSAVLSPAEWAAKAARLYDKYSADLILYEKNYGGDMIKAIFRQVRENLPLQEVWSKKGKIIRAEGPSLLYEQGKVKHVKGLLDLEEEQTTYTGASNQKSPNRLDAAVMCVQKLMLDGKDRYVSSSEFIL